MLLHVSAPPPQKKKKKKITIKIVYTKYMENCEAIRSSVHQLANFHIHINYSRICCCCENDENTNCKTILIFCPMFTVLFFFYSFYWINFNLDWISPLKVLMGRRTDDARGQDWTPLRECVRGRHRLLVMKCLRKGKVILQFGYTSPDIL